MAGQALVVLGRAHALLPCLPHERKRLDVSPTRDNDCSAHPRPVRRQPSILFSCSVSGSGMKSRNWKYERPRSVPIAVT